MSAISDFNKVWVQKFPGSELPAAWEEDVKTNLAKHKQRVLELQEELEKEQVYVQFLESLLEEVEKRKGESNSSGVRVRNANGDCAQEQNINDVIKDTLERRSLANQVPNNVSTDAKSRKLSSPIEPVLEEDIPADRRPAPDQQINEISPKEEHLEATSDDDGSGDETVEDTKDHFVTVIEVNGFEKAKLAGASSHEAKRSNNEEMKRLKKVPPPPPPKSFKRFGHEVNSQSGSRASAPACDPGPNVLDTENTKTTGSSLTSSLKSNIDRPVVFDSRKNSTGSTGTSGSSGSSNGGSGGNSSYPAEGASGSKIFPAKPQNSHGGAGALVKRFEGSKLPLPPPSSQNDLDEKIVNPAKAPKNPSHVDQQSSYSSHSQSSASNFHQSQSGERENQNVRSKILDMVNKMESSHKPMALNKNIEQLTPKRSSSSFRKHLQHSTKFQQAHNSDSIISDYIDPCDAEFDSTGDQIYDSPPPEIDPIPPPQLEAERKPSRTNTLESTGKPTNSQLEVIDLENEPMYDTVAPDQEDDYVLLLEDANQTSSSNNSLSKKDLSLDSVSIKKNEAASAVNNDAATIKSQTSVISSHSIATTTSSGTTSDTDGFTGSPLPYDNNSEAKNPSANYVNIDYFLSKSKRKDSQASGELEEDEPALLRAISYDQDGEAGDNADGEPPTSNLEIFEIDSGCYGSSVDSTSALGNAIPPVSGGSGCRGETRVGQSSGMEALTMTAAEQEKYTMFRYMLANIADSESAYVEVLNVMLQYMKALKATLATSKPVLSTDDFNIIFYKIPELFSLHQKFLMGLQQKTPSMTVGKHFENLAREICVYGAFLQNYSRAVDTVRKCGENNSDFAEITRSIRLRSLNKNQAVSLETLLYSPVSRVQKNIEIIQDLLKCLPESHPDHQSLKCALREFQSFLSDFKMIQPEQLFHGQDRNPRHLVKNSFIVELSEGHRKLRHLFLFTDVLVCAKYKASGKGEKFTFELKWYIPVSECNIVEECVEPRESATINLVALRSQASTVRDQIKRQTSRDDPKKAKAEKQRKKLAELEAQLVLASPNLVFKVKGNGRAYTFFLSSEFERSQWVDAVETLKSGHSSSSSQLSMHELQSWLTSCRKYLKTNMGSYLLRTGRDENLLVGDFYVLIGQLKGIQRPADLYICLEVDSYGHFFRKAKTKMICESTQPSWNQDFVIELEGAQNLRILLYEDHPRQGTLIRAKTTIELSRSWLTSSMNERKIELQDYSLTVSTKFIPSEMTIRRVPTAKPSGLYGAKITQVCKREKRQVPFIMTSCVREVERRGINEVGIYRVSGSASDVSRLKKAFETNSYEAEQLLKDVDIHSVTGALKMYMRELPEALFTDELYPRFFEAFNLPDIETKRKTLLQLFSTLPPINQHIIAFLLDHMTRVNSHENHNKMSLHNMATVFGPTLLRPGAKNEGSGNIDLLAAGTVDVMAQAGILYFFLTRRANGDPLSLPQ